VKEAVNWARCVHDALVRPAMPGWAVAYYDHLIESVADIYLAPLGERITRAFPGPARIVDAGAGTGNLTTLLTRGNPLYRVVGVDLSRYCLQAGYARNGREGVVDRAGFIAADLEHCPLASGTADLVISTCSLHHWRNPTRVLREMGRIVRASGEIWLLDHAASVQKGERRRWISKVERASRAGPLFQAVYSFESRFLSYGRKELEAMGAQSGLTFADYESMGVFFLARLVPVGVGG